ncbi:diguanylate cyclase domain-containing protein [Niveibacterium sp.]|uniref:diguanylate cyclase domain-containing protein n=1 Tax=Niveibacterium sp. TaxID=2017444 RepID=UPI0035B3DE4D
MSRRPIPLRLLAWLALALAVLGASVPAWAVAPQGVARIHFHRADGLYNGWGLHVWGEGHSLGEDTRWTEPLKPAGTTEFGVYFDVPVAEEATQLNFIIHRGAEKSVSTDQLLPLDEFNREVWVIAGDPKLYATEPGAMPIKSGIAVARQAVDRQPMAVWIALAVLVSVLVVGVVASRRSNRLREDIGRQTALLAEARAELARQTLAQSEAHAQSRSLAGIDELTGLLTRTGFRQALNAVQAKARRNRAGFALFFIDLDNFKPVNDQHGHAAGDQVLRTVASRLVAAVRESDTVARLGGDEFVVIADELADPLAAARLAYKLVGCATEVIEYGDHLLRVAASIGVAVYPHDGEDDALVAIADVAMYRAKNAGKNCFRFAAPEFDELVAQQDAAEERWRAALADGVLGVHWDVLVGADGAVWTRRLHAAAWSKEASRDVLLPDLVAPDAALALDADLLLLEHLAVAAEAERGGVWAMAPARSSLSDPRFVAACRGVVARIGALGATLVLEFDAGMVRPEGLADLVARGVRCALRVADPVRLRIETLLGDALHYVSVAAAGDDLHSRAVTAVAAAAESAGVPVVVRLVGDETVPEALHAVATLRLA